MKYFFILTIAFFTSCITEHKEKSIQQVSENPLNVNELYGEAQGTTYTIKYLSADTLGYQREIDSILKEIDLSMSTWVEVSLINKINNGNEGEYVVDDMFWEVLEQSQRISEETSGAYDASIAPIIYAWGIGFSSPKKLSKSTVDSLMKYTGNSNFQLQYGKVYKKKKQAKLDFNGIAQGYSVDIIADFLEQKNVGNYMVELGGEVKVKGLNKNNESWRIGIDKPKDRNMDRELNAIVSLNNKALATSGNYRKFYEVDGERFSHTIDPKTGFPVKHNLLSATVIAKKCSEADAYATALMVMGVEQGIQFLESNSGIQAYLIYSNKDGSYGEYISPMLKKDIQLLEVD